VFEAHCRAAAAAMALTSLTSAMEQQIEHIVMRRQQNWDYIKRAHQGKVHWLNVIKLSKASIVANFPQEKLQKRIRRWFLLGLSLGRLLELGDGPPLVRALAQLVEEYEHYIGAKKDMMAGAGVVGSAAQLRGAFGGLGGESGASAALAALASAVGSGDLGMPGQGQGPQVLLAPFLFLGTAHSSATAQATAAAAAAAAAAHGPPSSSLGGKGDASSSDAFKPTLHKNARGQVVYAYLQTCAGAGLFGDHLDYCELVQSLMDVLSLLYAKFLDPSCQPPAVHSALLRIDRKLRALVLSKLSQDLTQDVAQPLMKQELAGLLNHQFIDERTAQQGAARKFVQLDENAAADFDDGLEEHEEEER